VIRSENENIVHPAIKDGEGVFRAERAVSKIGKRRDRSRKVGLSPAKTPATARFRVASGRKDKEQGNGKAGTKGLGTGDERQKQVPRLR